MGDLQIDEDVRNDSGDITSGVENRIGYGLHETYSGSAVYEANAARGEGLCPDRGRPVDNQDGRRWRRRRRQRYCAREE